MGRFNKLYAALLGSAVYTAYQYYGDGVFSGEDTIRTALAVVGVFLVWMTANGPAGKVWGYAKTIAYAASSGLGAALTVLPDGLTKSEIMMLVMVVGTALGIFIQPNDPEPAGVRGR